ncbi:MAG: 16S rRNA (cytosine(967)-C(5))-methyltransferase RsmB [Aquisalimonadaceae bacterium]
MSARWAAARVLVQVIRDGRSVSDVLPSAVAALPEAERGLAQELVFGTLRWAPRLDALLDSVLQRPLRRRDMDVRALAMMGIYQCMETRVPDHAAVSATVDTARRLRQPWAPGLVNAVLRRFLRERETLQRALDSEPARFAHPQWLIDSLRQDWPEHWRSVLEANNARPPMTLRVNRRQSDRDTWLVRLRDSGLAAEPHAWAADAVTMAEPVAVQRLPGFAEGAVSVQDAAGQLAADLVAPAAGHRVLDLCAAPGSKTCHLLERNPGLAELTAVDIDAGRMQRLEENLIRLGLSAQVLVADASQPEQWWDGRPYDRILLDAPCSATGVIRRHPDIKLLRKSADIEALQALQCTLLAAVWPMLAPGGMLVYATCSMLRAENERVIERFVDAQDDAYAVSIDAGWGHARPQGRQIFVGDAGMDGFYYACVGKR